jgi:hypothetical protein
MMTCEWAEDEDGYWATECGHLFELVDGGPKDNGMAYCCYCGKTLGEHRHEPDEPDDART